MNVKNLAKIVAVTSGVLASTVGFGQTNKTLKIPEPDKAKVLKIDTSYVQDKGNALEQTNVVTIETKKSYGKDTTSLKVMEDNNLTEAYTGDLKNQIKQKDEQISNLQKFFKSTELGLSLGTVPANRDNSLAFDGLYSSLKLNFPIFHVGDGSGVYLATALNFKSPENSTSTSVYNVDRTVDHIDTLSAFDHQSQFYTTTSEDSKSWSLFGVGLKTKFPVGKSYFSLGALVNMGYTSTSTAVTSTRQDYKVSHLTGLSEKDGNPVDLGTENQTSKTFNPLSSVSFEGVYYGKENSQFGVGAYFNYGVTVPSSVGVTAVYKLGKTQSNEPSNENNVDLSYSGVKLQNWVKTTPSNQGN